MVTLFSGALNVCHVILSYLTIVAVLFEPVGAALGNGLDCGFECVHVVVFVFEPLHVAQEGWPVGDLAFMHG